MEKGNVIIVEDSSEKAIKKQIAFFDFDGTITTRDTLLEFLKFQKGFWRYWAGFIYNSLYIVLFKLKLIHNHKAKQKVFQFFWKELDKNEFEKNCLEFAENKLPHLIRPGAVTEINNLKTKGFEIVIVSASPGNWIIPWASKFEAQVISTNLEEKTGRLTGLIDGRNCHGEEKVNRIKAKFNLEEYELIHAYGDSAGDKPMLDLAHVPAYKPFR